MITLLTSERYEELDKTASRRRNGCSERDILRKHPGADQENNDPDGQYFHHKQQLFFKPQQSVRFKEHIRTEQVDRYPEQEHNHPEQVNRYSEQEYFQQEQRQFSYCFKDR